MPYTDRDHDEENCHIPRNLLYHLGRVATYTVIGGIMGGIGQLMAGAAGSGGVGAIKVSLWLIASALLLVLGITRLGIIREPGWLNAVSPEGIPGFKSALEGAAGDRGQSAFFLMGLMLGFLPCGLSYGAFAQALGSANALQGVLATSRLPLEPRPASSCWEPGRRLFSAATAGSRTSSPGS